MRDAEPVIPSKKAKKQAYFKTFAQNLSPFSKPAFKIDQIIGILDHDPQIENEFACRLADSGLKSMFVFHGTTSDCVYSLQRNGLRNLSQTKLMAIGAVHGNGIYLSKDFNIALHYSRPCAVRFSSADQLYKTSSSSDSSSSSSLQWHDKCLM